mmetsp:Transcript_18782/g.40688  ORF Transcript_18782/g.40688 Transcript_18782/m.40688 type:complete len:215 (+) Transcript_18782:1571-2215(+)
MTIVCPRPSTSSVSLTLLAMEFAAAKDWDLSLSSMKGTLLHLVEILDPLIAKRLDIVLMDNHLLFHLPLILTSHLVTKPPSRWISLLISSLMRFFGLLPTIAATDMNCFLQSTTLRKLHRRITIVCPRPSTHSLSRTLMAMEFAVQPDLDLTLSCMKGLLLHLVEIMEARRTQHLEIVKLIRHRCPAHQQTTPLPTPMPSPLMNRQRVEKRGFI